MIKLLRFFLTFILCRIHLIRVKRKMIESPYQASTDLHAGNIVALFSGQKKVEHTLLRCFSSQYREEV